MMLAIVGSSRLIYLASRDVSRREVEPEAEERFSKVIATHSSFKEGALLQMGHFPETSPLPISYDLS
jgi:hypothetical protein